MPRRKNEVETEKRSLEAKGFYSDATKTGTLYAALIRSPASTGKIKSIVLTDIPENYYIFTAKDFPGKKDLDINKNKIKIFGYDNVGYSGEPIGIIVGPDEQVISELLEKVTINFDIESLESALKNVIRHQKKPFINVSKFEENSQEETANNSELNSFLSEINDMPSLDTVLDKNHIEEYKQQTVAFREIKTGLYSQLEKEEADKQLFEESEDNIISSETWEEKLSDPSWQETSGAFCYFENKKLHVYAATKWTSFAMKSLSESLSIPIENIVIHKTKTTGVYSRGMWRTTQIMNQVALAAYITKKPVKLVLSQQEQDIYMIPGVKTKITYKTAMKKSGEVKALNANIDIDVGFCNPFAQEILDRITIASCNYYQFENVHIVAEAHTSKNPPTSICIKSIDSQVFFAIENQMQKLSDQAHLFPDEIRLINKKKINPYQISIPSDAIYECTSEAIKISDFNRKYAAFHMDAIDRVQKNSNPFFALPLRGVGISTAFNVSDFYGATTFSYEQKIEVTMVSKDKVVIHAIKPSAVIQDIWKDTAAEILQINKENIEIDSDFLISELPATPEQNFSTIGTMNELIKRACIDIQKKRFHQPLPITSKKGITSTAKKNWNQETFSGIPFTKPSFATCVVEVELDTYTYSEKIKGIWLTVDCGEIFDEAAAARTLKLEIQQELSMLVEGRTIPCDNYNIKFIKSKNKPGQMSALVHNTLPAAFSSALSLALATQLPSLPCTENRIFELIKERETAITKSSEEELTPEITEEQ